MDDYMIAITVLGIAALSMAWVPKILEKTFMSYPVVYMLLGVLLYLFGADLPTPDPLWRENYVVRLTELSIIVWLMGTGLKIRRRFSFKNWRIPLRLISITMLLSIGALALLGWSVLGFSIASAVLLGAVLAPTDPVLAEEVQVGPPDDADEDPVRFSLTAEAGLNNGFTFPFTWLAIVLAVSATSGANWLQDWVLYNLLYKVIAGVVTGYLIGRLLGYLIFKLPKKSKFPQAKDAFLALSASLVTYGVTELLYGYGFIAVFVAALTLSSTERDNDYHTEMHDFINQIERILMVIVLVLFGGSLVTGILDHLTWQGALVGLAFLFIIRPLITFPGLIGTNSTTKEKLAISFFGIRGIGAFYSLSFALDKTEFAEADALWSVVAFVVMVSIILHGVTASWALKGLDKARERMRHPVLGPDQTPDEL